MILHRNIRNEPPAGCKKKAGRQIGRWQVEIACGLWRAAIVSNFPHVASDRPSRAWPPTRLPICLLADLPTRPPHPQLEISTKNRA